MKKQGLGPGLVSTLFCVMSIGCPVMSQEPLLIDEPGYSITFPELTQLDSVEGEDIILPVGGAAGVAKIWYQKTKSQNSEDFIDSLMIGFESLIGGSVTRDPDSIKQYGRYNVHESVLHIQDAVILNDRVNELLKKDDTQIENGTLYYIETNTGIFLLASIQILDFLSPNSTIEKAMETLVIKDFPGTISIGLLICEPEHHKKKTQASIIPAGRQIEGISVSGKAGSLKAFGIYLPSARSRLNAALIKDK